MTLVDANVPIAHLRKSDPKLLAQFVSLPAALCGVTRAEVLGGAKNPADRAKTLALLNSFVQVSIPDALWDAVGDNLAALLAAGKPVPYPDVVLATVAIANDIEVWSRDQHFPLMQTVLSALKVYREPP